MAEPPDDPARSGASLKAQALRLLAQREHSRSELERKLRRKARDAARRLAAAGQEPPQRGVGGAVSVTSAPEGASEPVAGTAAADLDDLDDRIRAALDDLGARGFQSDARTAASVLHSQGARYGSRRLQQSLQAKGLAPDLVRATLAQAKGSELARARGVWAKRFGQVPADATERARQMRFLAGRGFGADVIRRVVAGAEDGFDGMDDPGHPADD